MISLCFTQCQWNFLLSSRPGFCRLSNFSIATSVRDTAGICTRQSGCLPYMAPELFTKSHRHGASADFWSLGCTMHELIYGLRPWTRTPSKCVSFLEGCVIEGDSGTRSPTAPARASARTPTSPGPLEEEFRLMAQRAEGKGVPLLVHKFMMSLLETRPWCRLSTQRMISLAEHPYFDLLDWTALEQRVATTTTTPPIIPGSNTSKRKPASSQFQNPVLLEELRAQVNEELVTMEDGAQDNFDFFTYYERPGKKTVCSSSTRAKAMNGKNKISSANRVSRAVSSHKSVLDGGGKKR